MVSFLSLTDMNCVTYTFTSVAGSPTLRSLLFGLRRISRPSNQLHHIQSVIPSNFEPYNHIWHHVAGQGRKIGATDVFLINSLNVFFGEARHLDAGDLEPEARDVLDDLAHVNVRIWLNQHKWFVLRGYVLLFGGLVGEFLDSILAPVDFYLVAYKQILFRNVEVTNSSQV